MEKNQEIIRCAIYTRKSHEAGLEQNFNSLDAQREACSAYITSQKHEGWQEVDTLYDDGGFSGGNMERPALKCLMNDIMLGKVDVVVVYKVDRLTRTLTDFAKIVEKFDATNVSFVSITQQFNTTSSMGRLTLNVLLSFAQFEREVTAERIRDKIAASRKKGMWTGGPTPLGYNKDNGTLLVNEEESEHIRFIFDSFLKHREVLAVRNEVMAKGILSKKRTLKNGTVRGGHIIAANSLRTLLRNPIYGGKIPHKGELYDGLHDALIPYEKWQEAQEALEKHVIAKSYLIRSKHPSMLKGLLFNTSDRPYTPKHGYRRGRRYCFYVASEGHDGPLRNLPAYDVEQLVVNAIIRALSRADKLRQLSDDTNQQKHLIQKAAQRKATIESMEPGEKSNLVQCLVRKVVVESQTITAQLDCIALRKYILQNEIEVLNQKDKDIKLIHMRAKVATHRKRHSVHLTIEGEKTDSSANPTICKALARAFVWNEKLVTGAVPSIRKLCELEGLNERYVMKILPLAWLPTKLIEELLNGEHQEMKLSDLFKNSSMATPQ